MEDLKRKIWELSGRNYYFIQCAIWDCGCDESDYRMIYAQILYMKSRRLEPADTVLRRVVPIAPPRFRGDRANGIFIAIPPADRGEMVYNDEMESFIENQTKVEGL